ncbi:GDYXXLXY domain-containing protein [Corallococcus interemptor]|uniref:GDYXXLXY domain-containing protein n=1 Tax=Corallococcus TaxID=83461 RepID=UPI001CBC46B7|nr:MULTISPECIES: GDYXXLXY domain-containing protein [unclassified Corallococcus]MBZ4331239.1 GDYXXLXY domain-containing protein [Corallococcus sp. AS-1-12]MBZ4370408.1 GDYXXLXY domain-containing protein [Corallococcus sp. AS-1-6]
MKRGAVIFGGLALVFVALAFLVVQKETVLARGQPVLLRLAPVDPRSLIQGDYMVLDYAINQGWREGREQPQEDGNVVLRLDEHNVGEFVRYEPPASTLAPGEVRLRFRIRNSQMRLGAEAFFFQEGHAERYANARYGELRVTDNGTSVLVGLRDENYQPLGSAIH